MERFCLGGPHVKAVQVFVLKVFWTFVEAPITAEAALFKKLERCGMHVR